MIGNLDAIFNCIFPIAAYFPIDILIMGLIGNYLRSCIFSSDFINILQPIQSFKPKKKLANKFCLNSTKLPWAIIKIDVNPICNKWKQQQHCVDLNFKKNNAIQLLSRGNFIMLRCHFEICWFYIRTECIHYLQMIATVIT